MDSHRGMRFKIAQVDSMVAKMLIMPDGMFRSALCFELYPKLWIKVAEKVVITPLGIVMQRVSKIKSHVCRSRSNSLSKCRPNCSGLGLDSSQPNRSSSSSFSF